MAAVASGLSRRSKGAPSPAETVSHQRWMPVAAWASGLIVMGALLFAAATWFVRSPLWTIRHIEFSGDIRRNNAATLQANTLPRLNGTFFNMDLRHAKQVFESVPWVRSAVVRRVWPDRLQIRLQEHQPAARWIGVDGNERLVNTFGEVFDANLGEVEGESLPVFSGPDGQAPKVMQMYLKLAAVFAPLERRVVRLDVSGRGSWGLLLDDETEVTIGRGTVPEVVSRTERFVATVTQVTSAYRTPLVQADLRHNNGYAVQLKGVMAIEASGKTKGK
jgi:cell division protein FtsQ